MEDTKDTTAEGLRTSSPAQEMPESQRVQESLRCEGDGDRSINPEVKSEHSDKEFERGINNGDDISAS